jgi:zinc D-Ala-D-Ala carboxypeptidase
MQLTQHFSLEEFTRSDTALRLGIDNRPPEHLVPVLLGTAKRLEHVRLILGVRIHVSSVYRCEALERVLCDGAFKQWCVRHGKDPALAWPEYFARKAHPKGMATDFTAPDFGTPLAIARVLARHSEELQFDQLIYEFTSWVHIGWSDLAELPARGQLLTIDGAGTRQGFPA